MIHHSQCLSLSLEPLAHSLTDRYRVLAFDARGHGHSSHPGAYSVLHFVADLADFLDAYELERPILIGHSLGGHSVANYAGLHPDRVRAAVLLEGLGPPMVPPSQDPESTVDHTRAMLQVLRNRRGTRPQPDVAAAADRLRATHPRLDPEWALSLAEAGTKPTSEGRVWRHDQRTWQWIASLDHHQLSHRWAAITAPVFAVSGDEAWETWWTRANGPVGDRVRMTDEQFAARLALFRDIEHVDLPEAGHMVHFDQPDRVNALVNDFLHRRITSP